MECKPSQNEIPNLKRIWPGLSTIFEYQPQSQTQSRNFLFLRLFNFLLFLFFANNCAYATLAFVYLCTNAFAFLQRHESTIAAILH